MKFVNLESFREQLFCVEERVENRWRVVCFQNAWEAKFHWYYQNLDFDRDNRSFLTDNYDVCTICLAIKKRMELVNINYNTWIKDKAFLVYCAI